MLPPSCFRVCRASLDGPQSAQTVAAPPSRKGRQPSQCREARLARLAVKQGQNAGDAPGQQRPRRVTRRIAGAINQELAVVDDRVAVAFPAAYPWDEVELSCPYFRALPVSLEWLRERETPFVSRGERVPLISFKRSVIRIHPAAGLAPEARPTPSPHGNHARKRVSARSDIDSFEGGA
jgi:hypothetical protein